MTGEDFSEWSSRTTTRAISVVVGFAFQTVPQDRVEALMLTYLEALKERAVASLSEGRVWGAMSRRNCTLPMHSHKNMMSNENGVTVYVVQALSRTTMEFALLGLFDTEARAQAFVDQAPLPQRERLHIHPWRLNQHTEHEFWGAEYKSLPGAEFLGATRHPHESEA